MRRTVLALGALALSPSCFAMPEIYAVMGPDMGHFRNAGPATAAGRNKTLEVNGYSFESETDHSHPGTDDGYVFSIGLGARFNRYVSAEFAVTEGLDWDRAYNVTVRDTSGQMRHAGGTVYLNTSDPTMSLLLNGRYPLSKRWGLFASAGAVRSRVQVTADLCDGACVSSVTGIKGMKTYEFPAVGSTHPIYRAGIDWTATSAGDIVLRAAYGRLSSSLPSSSGMPSTLTKESISLQAVMTFNSASK